MAAFPAPGTGVSRADQLVLHAAVSAYLGRYRGETRLHTESDLRVFLRLCTDQGLDPLAAVRVDIERYLRWLQDVRRYQPSTVSRRLSVVVGFYRVCVIDQILPHSPADYVRRPTVPAESPTLGLGHLQFEAATAGVRMPRMHLTAARDFADDRLSRSMTYLARMTTSRKDDLAEGLLLVAIVEMTHGHAAAGQRYEDAVLALLDRHGGSVERRLRRTDSATEVHLIRFRSRAGYESFMADPDRLAYRAEFGDAVPNTRVLEVREV